MPAYKSCDGVQHEKKIKASYSKGNSTTHGENSSAVQHRLDFLCSEYLQHAWTSLPTGTIHLLWLYSARHLKQVLQSSVIHTDHRANPRTFIVISEKRLRCDRHSWPERSRAGALSILGQRRPVPPKPELPTGKHQPGWLQGQPGRTWPSTATSDACSDKYRCI